MMKTLLLIIALTGSAFANENAININMLDDQLAWTENELVEQCLLEPANYPFVDCLVPIEVNKN